MKITIGQLKKIIKETSVGTFDANSRTIDDWDDFITNTKRSLLGVIRSLDQADAELSDILEKTNVSQLSSEIVTRIFPAISRWTPRTERSVRKIRSELKRVIGTADKIANRQANRQITSAIKELKRTTADVERFLDSLFASEPNEINEEIGTSVDKSAERSALVDDLIVCMANHRGSDPWS